MMQREQRICLIAIIIAMGLGPRNLPNHQALIHPKGVVMRGWMMKIQTKIYIMHFITLIESKAY